MRARRSTKIPLDQPKSVARSVANEIERTSNEAYSESAAADPRQFFERALGRLLSAANAETVKTVAWKDWAEQWYSEQAGAEKTLDKYRGALDRFTAFLGARARASLRTITHEDCQGFYKGMVREGLSLATCGQLFKIIRWAFQRAQLHGHIDRNPASLVKMEEGAAYPKKPFTQEEVGKILAHIEAHEEDEWRIACLFGLFYGLRLKDAINRSFEEIHDENGIRVLRFVPKKKARKGREISLPLVGELAGLKGQGRITPKLSRMSNPSKVFTRILKDAKIKVVMKKGTGEGRNQTDKSFHSWRHTVNSMLANNGVDVRLRQLISDHESQKMNAIYTHPDLEAIKTALGPIVKSVQPSGSAGQ